MIRLVRRRGLLLVLAGLLAAGLVPAAVFGQDAEAGAETNTEDGAESEAEAEKGAGNEGAAEAEVRVSSTGEMVRRHLYVAPVESESIPEERRRLFFELFKTWAAGNTGVVLAEIEAKAGCRLEMSGEVLAGAEPEDRSFRLSWRLTDLAFPEREPVEGSRVFEGMSTEDYYEEIFPALGREIDEAFPRVEQKQIEVIRKRIVEEVVIKERFKDGVMVTLTGEPGTQFTYRGNDYEIGDTGRLILEAPPHAVMEIRASRKGRLSDSFEFFVEEEPAEFALSLRKGAKWGLELIHRVPDLAPAVGAVYFLKPGQVYVTGWVEQNFLVYTYSTGDRTGDSGGSEDFWENPDEMADGTGDLWNRVYQPTFLQPTAGLGWFVSGEPDGMVRGAVQVTAFTRVVMDGNYQPAVSLSQAVTAGLQLGLLVEASPWERWRLVGGVHPRIFYSRGYRGEESLTEALYFNDWARPLNLSRGFYLQHSGVWTLGLRVLL